MDRKRVQMLRDMIAGIPAKQMNLNKVLDGGKNPCGAVGCILGWASIYPPFTEAKLPFQDWPAFFGLSGAVPSLFDFRQTYETGSDKQIALRRLDKLLDTGTQP